MKIINEINKYKIFFEQSLDTLLFLDIEINKFVLCNQNVFNTYGYTIEEFLQITPYDLSVEFTCKEYMETKQEEIINNGWAKFVTKHKKKNGNIIDVYIKSKKIEINEKLFLLINVTNINSELVLKEYFLYQNIEKNKILKINENYQWDLFENTLWERNVKVQLTRKETLLIKTFLKYEGLVLSKFDLEKMIELENFTDQAVVALIKRIRKKLKYTLIDTIYSKGYKIW